MDTLSVAEGSSESGLHYTESTKNEYYLRLADHAQKVMGQRANFAILSITHLAPSQKEATSGTRIIDSMEGKVGVIDIPNFFLTETDRVEVFGHEFAHLMVIGEPAVIRDSPGGELYEGIGDLVGLEVADLMLGKQSKPFVVASRLADYRKKIAEAKGPETVLPESILGGQDHVLGRYIVYSLASKFPGVQAAVFKDYLLSHPPAFGDISDPEKYLENFPDLSKNKKKVLTDPTKLTVNSGNTRLRLI